MKECKAQIHERPKLQLLLLAGVVAAAGALSAQVALAISPVFFGQNQGLAKVTWTGRGQNSKWSNPANWYRGKVPGTGDLAIFDGTCVRCDATIDSNASVSGLSLQESYTGTITQAAGKTLTVGTSNWTLAGGTFAGGDSTITLNGTFTQTGGSFSGGSAPITLNAAFSLSGGAFAAPSNTITANNSWSVSGTPTFNAGASTLVFKGGSISTAGTETYNNVTLMSGNVTLSGTLRVGGVLTGSNGGGKTYTGGTILALGDVTETGTGDGFFSAGTTVLQVGGSSNQTITGTANGVINNLQIASTGGTVYLSGNIKLNGNYVFTSGTLNAGTSTLIFNAWGTTISAGSEIYNNVTFNGGSSTISGTLNVAGTLYGSIAYNASVNSAAAGGVINALGNVTVNSSGLQGSIKVAVAGSSDQTITGTSNGIIPNLTIASTGGTVYLSGTIQLNGNYVFTSGNLNAGTSTLIFNAWGTTISAGSEIYNNITFNGGGSTISGTLNVAGLLYGSINYQTSINPASTGGVINALGNVTVNSSGLQGSIQVNVAGSSDQTITGTSNGIIPNLTIASTGGTVYLSGSIYVTANYTFTSGTLNAGTSTLGFQNGSRTITVGSEVYNNVRFALWNNTTITFIGTMNVGGTLTGSTGGTFNGGGINALGNLSLSGAGLAYGGTTTLTFSGSANATWTGITGSGGGIPGSTVTIAKTDGAKVTLASATQVNNSGQTLAITSGSLDMAGYALTVKALALNSTTVTKNGGVLTVNGTAAGIGSLYGGTVDP